MELQINATYRDRAPEPKDIFCPRIPYFPEVVEAYYLSTLAGLVYGLIVYYSVWYGNEFRFTDEQLGKILRRKRTQIKSALKELRTFGLIESELTRFYAPDNDCKKEYDSDGNVHICDGLCQFSTRTPRLIKLLITPLEINVKEWIFYKSSARPHYSDKEILLKQLIQSDVQRHVTRSDEEIMQLLGWKSEKSLHRAYKKISFVPHFFSLDKNRPQIINNIMNICNKRKSNVSVPVYDEAVCLFRQGFRIIPVHPVTNQPLIPNWHTYLNKENTEEEIFYWFGGWRSDNIGIGVLPAEEKEVKSENVKYLEALYWPPRYDYTGKVNMPVFRLIKEYGYRPVGERNISLFAVSIRLNLIRDLDVAHTFLQLINSTYDEPFSEYEVTKIHKQGFKYACMIQWRNLARKNNQESTATATSSHT